LGEEYTRVGITFYKVADHS